MSGAVHVKGITIYDTSYGNIKRISETIAETIRESGVEVDLFNVEDVKKLGVKNYNFLVLGSPKKFGTRSFEIRFFLGKVRSAAEKISFHIGTIVIFLEMNKKWHNTKLS